MECRRSLSDQPRNPARAYSDHRPDEGAAAPPQKAVAPRHLRRCLLPKGLVMRVAPVERPGPDLYELDGREDRRRARRRCRATRFISACRSGRRRSMPFFAPCGDSSRDEGIHRHGGADDGRVTAARDSRASCRGETARAVRSRVDSVRCVARSFLADRITQSSGLGSACFR